MFSQQEYKELLQLVSLSETEREILIALNNAGDEGKTASELASALSITSHVIVNRVFWGLGHKLSTAADKKPEIRQNGTYRWWRVLASDRAIKDRGFVWILHDDLRKALEELGLGKISYGQEFEKQFRSAVVLSLRSQPDARRKRLENAQKMPSKIEVVSVSFQRNPDVVAEVLLRAKGYCEHCKNPAPFLRRSDQSPYLEVHHIKPLVDGGEDTVANALALCPNCHRMAHYA